MLMGTFPPEIQEGLKASHLSFLAGSVFLISLHILFL